MGQVAALFLDVTQGWRSLAATVAVLEREASHLNAPTEYLGRLNSIATSLVLAARAEEALTLATLSGVAADRAHGRTSVEWIQATTALVQAAAAIWSPFDEKLAAAPPHTSELVARARELGRDQLLAAALSASGQFWHRVARDREEDEGLQELLRAERELREAVRMRAGAERGRTLSSLAQVQATLATRGHIAEEAVAATAQEALQHIDRQDRPVQWLAARSLGRSYGMDVSGERDFDGSELLAVCDRHDDNIARECLALQATDLSEHGYASDAADLLEALWEPLHVRECPSERTLERLLTVAIQSLDRGIIPCRAVSAEEEIELFSGTERLSATEQLAARLHLAIASPDGGPSSGWAITHAPMLAAGFEPSALSYAATFALAVIHARRSAADWQEDDPAFLFRCSLLAAVGFMRVGLRGNAKGALSVGIVLLEGWTASIAQLSGEAKIDEARHQLEGVLDGCLREAATVDGELSDMGREWLLRVGRILSTATHAGATAQPILATMHSLAFKGALSGQLISSDIPWAEGEGPRQTRREIASLDHEPTDSMASVEAPHPLDEELRLCAWLHAAERQSGTTARQLRRNLQAQYDEMLIRSMRRVKEPSVEAPLGGNAPPEQLLASTAVLDIYLGRNVTGGYACHSIFRLPQEMRRYSVNQVYEEIEPMPDPSDEHASLLLDGLAPLVASVRHRVLEPPGARRVSRDGAAALMAASQNVLGWDGEDLRVLRESGCDHIVVCPHGPLAFLPFHLLPIENSVLADSFTVTTSPSLSTLFAVSKPFDGQPVVELGVVASPHGGVSFGLHAEPRLAEQARELASISSSSRLLTDGAATPEATLALLAESRYAHIASHGSGLSQIPSFHCVYLDARDGLDGRLFAEQIMRSDLRGLELVTLCACETALGRVDPAGNVRGLPFALMVAGAKAVVATLWPVAAEPALHFFSVLHRDLAAGAGKLHAFRSAQLSCREQHPRFADWGAFIYIGSWG